MSSGKLRIGYPFPAKPSANEARNDRSPPTLDEAFTAFVLIGLAWGLGYGLTNWLSSFRATHTVWYHEYERNIPFCWWMIAPYVSMNVFYAVAPFACKSRRELRILVRRLTMMIAVAATVFVLWPSYYSWQRPAPESLVQSMLHGLIDLDAPYNVVPSLHAAMALPLLRVFRRCCGGLLRDVVRCWFVLIIVSTVLTYQHHVLDCAAGLVLGLACRRWIDADTSFPSLVPAWRTLRESFAWRGTNLARVERAAVAVSEST